MKNMAIDQCGDINSAETNGLDEEYFASLLGIDDDNSFFTAWQFCDAMDFIDAMPYEPDQIFWIDAQELSENIFDALQIGVTADFYLFYGVGHSCNLSGAAVRNDDGNTEISRMTVILSKEFGANEQLS
ncbi:hypothetical protein ACJX0J_028686 [Zea mays]